MTRKSVEKHRMRELLAEAVSVLCKASLEFRYKFSVEGLLGITLDDDDVFLVNINEIYQKDDQPSTPQKNAAVLPDGGPAMGQRSTDISPQALMMNTTPPAQAHRKRHLSSTDSEMFKHRRVSSPSGDYSRGGMSMSCEEYENQPPSDTNVGINSLHGVESHQFQGLSEHRTATTPKQDGSIDYQHYRSSAGTDSDTTSSPGYPSNNGLPLSNLHQQSQQQQLLLGSLNLATSCPESQWKNQWISNETIVQNKRRSFAFPQAKGVMIPLYADPDDPEKYSDVLVDSTAISELQSQSSRSRNPGAYLLNGLIDIIFTKEELATSKGITSKEVPLNPHKVEACKDFVWAKCKMKGWCPPERFTRIFSNKIGNARRDLKTQHQRVHGERGMDGQGELVGDLSADEPAGDMQNVKEEDPCEAGGTSQMPAGAREPARDQVYQMPRIDIKPESSRAYQSPQTDSCPDKSVPVRPDPAF